VTKETALAALKEAIKDFQEGCSAFALYHINDAIDALESSPCACGGEKPLAVVETYLAKFWLEEGKLRPEVAFAFGPEGLAEKERAVTLIILPREVKSEV